MSLEGFLSFPHNCRFGTLLRILYIYIYWNYAIIFAMTLMIQGLFSSSFDLYIVTLYLALLLLVYIQPTIPGLCHYIIYHRVLFKDLYASWRNIETYPYVHYYDHIWFNARKPYICAILVFKTFSDSLVNVWTWLPLCYISIWVRAWLGNHIYVKQWDINIHPCPNFNGGFVKPPLKFGCGWVIASDIKSLMQLFIRAPIWVCPS